MGEQTTLAGMIRMVEEASASKAPVARLADKVCGVFVPVILGISLVTALVWFMVSGNAEFSLSCGVSVLVIACPCSLGLATPAAVMAGTGKGAELGILYRNAEALEKAGKVEVADENGEKKAAVDKEDLEKAETKFNEAAESAEEEKETAAEGENTQPEAKEPASKSQFVGAVAVVVGNVSNNAAIVGSEEAKITIELTGSLSVTGEALVSYASVADGSAVVPTEGDETVDKSVGVAVVVQVLNVSNVAAVDYAEITAEDLTVTANSGSHEGEEAIGGSSATAKAGFSAGNFGLGGAIAVNVAGFDTNACIDNAEVVLELFWHSI